MSVLDEIKSGQIRIENGVLRIESKVTELDKRTSGRLITAEQALKMRPLLQTSDQMTLMVVLMNTNDGESVTFRDGIRNAFIAAGWSAPVRLPRSNNALQMPSLVVMVPNEQWRTTLRAAFSAIGLDPPIKIGGPEVTENQIVIFVGPRPA